MDIYIIMIDLVFLLQSEVDKDQVYTEKTKYVNYSIQDHEITNIFIMVERTEMNYTSTLKFVFCTKQLIFYSAGN